MYLTAAIILVILVQLLLRGAWPAWTRMVTDVAACGLIILLLLGTRIWNWSGMAQEFAYKRELQEELMQTRREDTLARRQFYDPNSYFYKYQRVRKEENMVDSHVRVTDNDAFLFRDEPYYGNGLTLPEQATDVVLVQGETRRGNASPALIEDAITNAPPLPRPAAPAPPPLLLAPAPHH